MIVPTYRPGDWYAVVTDGSIALLAPDTEPATVTALWEAARRGEGLTAQLQALLTRPLAELGPFVLLSVAAGRAHAVVRGDVVVEVGTAAGVRTVSAGHVATWTEELVEDARSVEVRAGAPADGGARLPVLSAVVRVAAVGLDLTRTRDGGSRASAPATAQRPAPAAPTARVEQQDTAALRPVRPDVPAPAASPEVTPEPVASPEPAPSPEPVAFAEPATDPAAVPSTNGVDHDGLTVLSSDVVALRRQMPEWAGDEVPGPLDVAGARPRPPAKIVLSSGLVVALNRPVLLGRAPQVNRVSNDRLPRLVTVASPNQDISRTHAEVRQEGDDVLVTDLRSTNGVLLLRQGGTPQRLHPGEPTVVEPNVVVDLGEGVTFVVEHAT